jgi:uncharacterized phage-associated protein
MKLRTPNEAIVDRFLLLYLLFTIRKKGYNITGYTKLQKLLYKIEETFYRERYKGLNYNFVFWKHGPFDPQIKWDVEDLQQTNLIKPTDKVIEYTDSGKKLIETLQHVFERNSKVVEVVNKVVNELGPLNSREIKAAMYAYPKVGEKKPIRQSRKGEFILNRLEDSEASDRFYIDDSTLETLEVLFDPKAYKAIHEGLKAIKEEEGKPFTPVL